MTPAISKISRVRGKIASAFECSDWDEVPSHQWIDLTDMSGEFGATVLTDCKNGSDKPNDNTIRLTLIRTPGTAGGYADQGTQDIGHHEFVYGIAGHSAGWREAQTDWQAQRLNAPLIAFATAKHTGAMGRTFSLLRVNNPRIRVLAVKKAEQSDEVIVRLVELDGKPQPNVQVSFATAITSAREVNGQEQPVGSATVDHGVLVTSFGAYQPRTFALHLAASSSKVATAHSTPVVLRYDLATASNDGARSGAGFDGKGNALPAEMLPAQILFNDVTFELARAATGTPNAVVAKGQTISLPAGTFNRVYLLAASANGDQKGSFEIANKKFDLNIQDWSGFIGQWDDRQWSSKDTSHDDYGDMIGLKPAYIKRADLAWYCSHHHNAAGANVPYAYSYLFAYAIDAPTDAKTIKLPNNNNVRILAISVADEDPELRSAQPLYDVLPSPNAGPSDFTLTTSSANVSIPQGRSTTTRIVAMPRGSFNGPITLSASGLPQGVSASFNPASTSAVSTMTLTAAASTMPVNATLTVTGTAKNLSHSITTAVTVTPVLSRTIPVDLSSVYNVTGIYRDGSIFAPDASLDGDGYSFSGELLGTEQIGNGAVFKLGPSNAPDVVTGKTVLLPADKYSSVKVLATGVNGAQELQTFTVTYTDGSSTSYTQNLSDWAEPKNFNGEFEAASLPYRLRADGSKDARTFYAHAYSFILDSQNVVRSLSLPSNRDVLIFAVTLVPAH